jgi:hypothetical protein
MTVRDPPMSTGVRRVSPEFLVWAVRGQVLVQQRLELLLPDEQRVFARDDRLFVANEFLLDLGSRQQQTTHRFSVAARSTLQPDVTVLMRGAIDLAVRFAHLFAAREQNAVQMERVFVVRRQEQTAFDGLDRLVALHRDRRQRVTIVRRPSSRTNLVDEGEILREMEVRHGVVGIESDRSERRRSDRQRATCHARHARGVNRLAESGDGRLEETLPVLVNRRLSRFERLGQREQKDRSRRRRIGEIFRLFAVADGFVDLHTDENGRV